MACFDLEMQLCAAKSIATAITSDAYDFGQPAPNSGAWADPIYLVIHPTVAGTGTEAATNGVTFSIDDSDDGSDFTSILTLPAMAGADVKEDIVIPLPVKHRQHVRLSSTIKGTITGTIDAYLTTSFGLPNQYKKVGIDIVPTTD